MNTYTYDPPVEITYDPMPCYTQCQYPQFRNSDTDLHYQLLNSLLIESLELTEQNTTPITYKNLLRFMRDQLSSESLLSSEIAPSNPYVNL